jgi:hypothetical protein
MSNEIMISARLLDVPYNEAQEAFCTATHSGDMKMLFVAYVSGFIDRHLILITAVMLARPV